MPCAMTADDIADVERRFVKTALPAERTGFTGVEVHVAHGYLISQFLSPLAIVPDLPAAGNRAGAMCLR